MRALLINKTTFFNQLKYWNMKYTRDQHLQISENIRMYGGSFIKCIGEALIKADHQNAKKLEEAFAEEFERYLNM